MTQDRTTNRNDFVETEFSLEDHRNARLVIELFRWFERKSIWFRLIIWILIAAFFTEGTYDYLMASLRNESL